MGGREDRAATAILPAMVATAATAHRAMIRSSRATAAPAAREVTTPTTARADRAEAAAMAAPATTTSPAETGAQAATGVTAAPTGETPAMEEMEATGGPEEMALHQLGQELLEALAETVVMPATRRMAMPEKEEMAARGALVEMAIVVQEDPGGTAETQVRVAMHRMETAATEAMAEAVDPVAMGLRTNLAGMAGRAAMVVTEETVTQTEVTEVQKAVAVRGVPAIRMGTTAPTATAAAMARHSHP
mgnify:CR=1 FL=1